MQIKELGYRRWDAPLKSLLSGWSVIAETGVALAWRGSWVRRILFFAFLPTIPVTIAFFGFEFAQTNPEWAQVVGQAFGNAESPLYNEKVADALTTGTAEEARHAVWSALLLFFFRVPQGVAMVLVVGLIAPKLISQDVRSRAFLLYFSRPISVIQYVVGKSAILWFFIAWIVTLPALLLYVIGVSVSPDISVVMSTYDLPFRILAASTVLIVPTTSLALCYSSLTTETRNAGFLWFATWIIGWVIFTALTGYDAAVELSNQQRPRRPRMPAVQIFEDPAQLEQLDLPPEVKDEILLLLDQEVSEEDRRVVEEQIRTILQIHYFQEFRNERQQRSKDEVDLKTKSRWSIFSLFHTLGKVQTWVFGLEKDFSKVLPSVVLLALTTFFSLAILFRRVTAPLRV